MTLGLLSRAPASKEGPIHTGMLPDWSEVAYGVGCCVCCCSAVTSPQHPIPWIWFHSGNITLSFLAWARHVGVASGVKLAICSTSWQQKWQMSCILQRSCKVLQTILGSATTSIQEKGSCMQTVPWKKMYRRYILGLLDFHQERLERTVQRDIANT